LFCNTFFTIFDTSVSRIGEANEIYTKLIDSRIMRENDMLEKEEIFSKVLRAGFGRNQNVEICQRMGSAE
jgi:hypothetical protein